MGTYQVALSIHVLAAVIWVGGAVVIQLLAWQVVRRDDALEISRFSSDAEKVGLRVFMPASLLVIAAGSWMVYDGPWELGTTWLDVSIALFALSFITGMGFLGPESGRISELTEEHGAEHPDVVRRIKRILLVSRVELIWLIAIVLLMASKPAW